jgi:hypothetical protein
MMRTGQEQTADGSPLEAALCCAGHGCVGRDSRRLSLVLVVLIKPNIMDAIAAELAAALVARLTQ